MESNAVNLVNHQFRLAARPIGMPKPTDWSYTEEPVRQPGEGELLVKVLSISLDPAMRGWMNAGRSYIAPVELGAVMRAMGAGRVIASRNPEFREGDTVTGVFGVQEYALSNGNGINTVDVSFVPLHVYLSVLGATGLTAYFGLLDVGQPKAGETVVLSGAAGAVGAVAGQIAKIKGCRVIGIAGGPEKCNYIVKELGFDAAIDYKAEDVKTALAKHCQKGVDVYFDNVGGEILDTLLLFLNKRARVVICGAISQYNNTTPIIGPSNYLSLLVNHARMEGFVVFDYAAQYREGLRELAGWLAAGKLKSREDVVKGLETFPETLLKLYKGENFGKLILQVAEA
jgi:NADPH-dependent curcumin reductase CurA